MTDAVAHLRAVGESAPDDLLAHTSPVSWEHIAFSGDFLWDRASAVPPERRAQTRPKRTPSCLKEVVLVAFALRLALLSEQPLRCPQSLQSKELRLSLAYKAAENPSELLLRLILRNAEYGLGTVPTISASYEAVCTSVRYENCSSWQPISIV